MIKNMSIAYFLFMNLNKDLEKDKNIIFHVKFFFVAGQQILCLLQDIPVKFKVAFALNLHYRQLICLKCVIYLIIKFAAKI